MEFLLIALIPIALVLLLGMLTLAAWLVRPQPDPATTLLVLRHSWWLKGFALFAAFGIPLAITVLVYFQPPQDDGDLGAILGLYTGFALLSGPLLWESLRYALIVSDEGLECRSPWKGTAFLHWDEIDAITYGRQNSWFIIRATDGYKFRISFMVPGISRFLAECERHLPPTALMEAYQAFEVLNWSLPSKKKATDSCAPSAAPQRAAALGAAPTTTTVSDRAPRKTEP